MKKHGVLLERSPLPVSTASADEFASSRSPSRCSPAPAAVRRQRAKAVSTHCMVFVHAATGRCPRDFVRFALGLADRRFRRCHMRPANRWRILRTPASRGLLGYASRRSRRVPADSCGGVGTGVEPVTPRSIVWCSTSELTSRHRHRHNPCTEHTDPNPTGWIEAPLVQTISRPCFEETPAGVEPAEICFAGSCLAVWLQRQVTSPAANAGRSIVIHL